MGTFLNFLRPIDGKGSKSLLCKIYICKIFFLLNVFNIKSKVIHARVNDAEKKQIEKMVMEGGYGNVTNLIRSVLLGKKEVPKKRISKKGMPKQYRIDEQGKIVIKHPRSDDYMLCKWSTSRFEEEGVVLYESIEKFDWLIWKLAGQGIKGKNLRNGKFFYRIRQVKDYFFLCTWGEIISINWGRYNYVYIKFKDNMEFVIPKVILKIKL